MPRDGPPPKVIELISLLAHLFEQINEIAQVRRLYTIPEEPQDFVEEQEVVQTPPEETE